MVSSLSHKIGPTTTGLCRQARAAGPLLFFLSLSGVNKKTASRIFSRWRPDQPCISTSRDVKTSLNPSDIWFAAPAYIMASIKKAASRIFSRWRPDQPCISTSRDVKTSLNPITIVQKWSREVKSFFNRGLLGFLWEGRNTASFASLAAGGASRSSKDTLVPVPPSGTVVPRPSVLTPWSLPFSLAVRAI